MKESPHFLPRRPLLPISSLPMIPDGSEPNTPYAQYAPYGSYSYQQSNRESETGRKVKQFNFSVLDKV